MSEYDAAGRIITTAVDAFGSVDILVNNAGLSAGSVIWELEPELFNRVTAVHIQGAFNCTRHAVTHMKQRAWGRIVNLVSRSGLIGVAGSAAYGTGKGGLFGFTNVISRDLARFGITVNGVNPSSTDTRMVSEAIEKGVQEGGARAKMAAGLKAVLQTPQDVAVLIAALCSERAAGINGQFFFVRRTEVGLFQPLTLTQTMSRDRLFRRRLRPGRLCRNRAGRKFSLRRSYPGALQDGLLRVGLVRQPVFRTMARRGSRGLGASCERGGQIQISGFRASADRSLRRRSAAGFHRPPQSRFAR